MFRYLFALKNFVSCRHDQASGKSPRNGAATAVRRPGRHRARDADALAGEGGEPEEIGRGALCRPCLRALHRRSAANFASRDGTWRPRSAASSNEAHRVHRAAAIEATAETARRVDDSDRLYITRPAVPARWRFACATANSAVRFRNRRAVWPRDRPDRQTSRGRAEGCVTREVSVLRLLHDRQARPMEIVNRNNPTSRARTGECWQPTLFR